MIIKSIYDRFNGVTWGSDHLVLKITICWSFLYYLLIKAAILFSQTLCWIIPLLLSHFPIWMLFLSTFVTFISIFTPEHAQLPGISDQFDNQCHTDSGLFRPY